MSAPVVRLLDARRTGLDERGLRAWARAVSSCLGPPRATRSYRFPYALVAASDGPVGVDLERVEPVDRAFAVSIATPDERGALDAGEAGDDIAAWAIALWSAKEALAKALGDAVAYDPRRLPSPLRWPNLRAGAWRAARVAVPAHHTGWLCWRTAGGDPDVPERFVMQDPLSEPAVRRLATNAAAARREAETPECPDSGIPAGAVPAEYAAWIAAVPAKPASRRREARGASAASA
ncbi:MAG: hypothetical protein JWO74_4050 [Solirubrobacterales bacterium]|nr:hypothetical protein [Solirubrobacterales bacterium]